MANGANFPYDPQMTAVANAIDQRDLVGSNIFPVVATDTRTFEYLDVPRDQAFRIYETIIGAKGIPNEVEIFGNVQTGRTKDHALVGVVANRTLEIVRRGRSRNGRARAQDPRAATVEVVRRALDLQKEIEFSELVTDPANYPVAQRTTLSGTSQWSHADADPARAIRRTARTMLQRPNVLVIGEDVEGELLVHPKIILAYQAETKIQEGVVSLDWLAQFLGFEEVWVVQAIYATNAPDAAPVFEKAFDPKMAAMFHASTTTVAGLDGAPLILTWAAEFYTPIEGGGQYYANSWTDPEPGPGSGVERIKIGTSYTYKVISPDFGWLWIDAVA